MDLLRFALTPYTLLPALAMVVYGYLFVKVYQQSRQLRSSRWFLAYLGISLAAGIPSVLASASLDPSDAVIFTSLFFAINIFAFPALLGFTFLYTNHDQPFASFWPRLSIFLPSVAISFAALGTNFIVSHNPARAQLISAFWQPAPGPLYPPLYIGWLHVVIFSCIFLLAAHAIRVKDQHMRQRSLIYIAALVIQTVFGLIVMVVLPAILGQPLIPDSIFLTTIMGVTIAYGILRYDLFVVSPTTVASNIVATMGEAVVTVNPDGNIESVNPAMVSMLGFAEHELVGQPVGQLFRPNDSPLTADVFKQARQAHGAHLETILVDKHRRHIPVSLSVSVISKEDGQTAGIVLVAADITHLRELSEVTGQRDKLDAIMSSITDGVLALTSAGAIIQANQTAGELLSIDPKRAIGKKLDEVVQLRQKDQPVATAELLKQLENPHSDLAFREVTVLASSKERSLQVTAKIIEEHKHKEFIVTLHDVTQLKELEAMKLDFVSMAAHELRTPLTAIRGYLSILSEETDTKLNKQEQTFLARSLISSNDLSALVENLLNVSRIERGVFKLEVAPLSIESLIDSTMANLHEVAKQKNITLTFAKPSKPLPLVLADRFRVSEVVTNLTANAINYTATGGAVAISLEQSDNTVVIHVTDTGHGIPASAMPHLFTKFYRVSGTLAQGSKGTGLGLYISKAIVDAHHGKIWVDSVEGKGSTFSFSLPLAPAGSHEPIFGKMEDASAKPITGHG